MESEKYEFKSEEERDQWVNNLVSDDRKKQIIRGMDLRIVPWTAWLYLLNSLDRQNMGAAKIANSEVGHSPQQELGITETEWQGAISFFFITYVIFEIPSNMVIKRFGPARHMSRIIVMWGISAMCMGFCQNVGGFYACRVALGLSEAGYYPGMMFLYSAWYTKKEIGTRIGVFYASASVGGAFGGLLAYAISFMDGAGGYSGWRWIFILEGAPSIASGIISWFILPNFPKDAKWLEAHEIQWLEQRLGKNAPSAHDKHFDKEQFIDVFTDIHSYLFSLFYFAHVTALYGIAYYLPTIIKNLGFVSTTAQLMTVPPNICGFFLTTSLGYTSDRLQDRAFHLLALETGFAVAFILYMTVLPVGSGIGVLYFGACLGVACMSAFIPIIWAWRSNTAKGTTHLAVASGLMNSFGNIGGAIGSFMFRADWAPRYVQSFAICLGLAVVAILGITTEYILRRREAARAKELLAASA